MEKILIRSASAILVLVGLLLASCSSPMTGNKLSTSTTVVPGNGKTLLTIGDGSSDSTIRARTVLPSMPTVASYNLSANSGSGFVVVASFTSLPANASINQGTYDFKLEAIDGGGNVVLAQVQLGVVVGAASLALNFTLTPILAGNGTISVVVNWPATVTVASADTLFGLVGGTQTTTAATIDASSTTFTQSSVASGNYLLTVRLKDGNGKILASVLEVVRVFQNLLSTKTISLLSTDFNSPPNPPTGLAATAGNAQAVLNWTDASNNETGFSVERTTNGGSTWTVLTTTPLLAGTITYADTSIVAGSTVQYRVQSINSFGGSPYNYSNILTTYSVTYNASGATGGAVPVDSNCYINAQTVTVLGNTGSLVNPGYAFAGWTTCNSQSATGSSYATGATFAVGTSSTVLYAVWVPTNLTFSSNGASIAIIAYSTTAPTGVLTIPTGITTVGAFFLQYCNGLTSINIPASVTSIGNGAFIGETSLTSISVDFSNPDYESISGILYDKSGATLITVPPTISGVFAIPLSVTTVGDYAFYGCASLSSIVISPNVTIINTSAFSACSGLSSITVDPANPDFESISGVLYDKAGKTLLQAPATISGALTIPSGVTTLGEDCFNCCFGLTSVTISSNVAEIDDGAFGTCTSLTTVTIGSGVNSIGTGAFEFDTSLTSVVVPANVTSIGILAFAACAKLANVTMQSTTPPTLGISAFSGEPNGFKIHVPSAAAVTAYKAAPIWSNYASEIVTP